MEDITVVDHVIHMRRDLAGLAARHAQLGEAPADGIRLPIPEDPLWWLQLVPVDVGSEDSDEPEWQILEVQAGTPLLPERRAVLVTGDAETVLDAVDSQYRRLLLERRNAACGTPVRRP